MFDGPKAVHDAGRPERPLVMAYYTLETPYQHEAELLKPSLETVGYSYDIRGIPNQGSWQRNTQIKALFVQHMLNVYPGQPLLYLDIDAVMIMPPVLLDNLDADIAAVHYLNQKQTLLSGTVWFGNTTQCRRIVEKWIRLNHMYPKTLPNGRPAWDQRTLSMAIDKIASCRFVELPQEYTWIVELTQRNLPKLSPVIMHTRGAHRFKKIINGQKGYEK